MSIATIMRCTGLAIGLFLIGCGSGGGEIAFDKLEPEGGPTQGDSPVRIVGRNFRPDIGYTVYFGTKRAGTATILDPQTMVVQAPQQEDPGVVDIHIRADDGSAFRIKQAYTYREVAGEAGGAGAEKKSKLVY